MCARRCRGSLTSPVSDTPSPTNDDGTREPEPCQSRFRAPWPSCSDGHIALVDPRKWGTYNRFTTGEGRGTDTGKPSIGVINGQDSEGDTDGPGRPSKRQDRQPSRRNNPDRTGRVQRRRRGRDRSIATACGDSDKPRRVLDRGTWAARMGTFRQPDADRRRGPAAE